MSRWIVDKCLRGDLIEGRTVLLVVSYLFEKTTACQTLTSVTQTHNIGMTAPLADFVVTVGSNGRVTSQDSIPEALSTDLELREAVEDNAEIEEKEEEAVDEKVPAKEKKPSGQLIANEETAEVRIVCSACESRELGVVSQSRAIACHPKHSRWDPGIEERIVASKGRGIQTP